MILALFPLSFSRLFTKNRLLSFDLIESIYFIYKLHALYSSAQFNIKKSLAMVGETTLLLRIHVQKFKVTSHATAFLLSRCLNWKLEVKEKIIYLTPGKKKLYKKIKVKLIIFFPFNFF